MSHGLSKELAKIKVTSKVVHQSQGENRAEHRFNTIHTYRESGRARNKGPIKNHLDKNQVRGMMQMRSRAPKIVSSGKPQVARKQSIINRFFPQKKAP